MNSLKKILILMLIPQVFLFAGSSFSASRLKESLEDYINFSLGDNIGIQFITQLKDYNFTLEEVEAEFSEISRSNTLQKLELIFKSDNNIIKKEEIYFSIKKEILVPHAKKLIRKGDTFTKDDFELRMLKVNAEQVLDIPKIEDLIGKKASQNIGRGVLVSNVMLEDSFKIGKGEKVLVYANSQGLSIKLEATALQDARIGEPIRIQKEDKQILQGRVRQDGTIEITH